MSSAFTTLLRVAANMLWLLSCIPDYVLFQLAAWFPRAAQRRVLRGILRSIQGGQDRSQFTSLPVTSYEDYRGDIERIMDGTLRGLTGERVLLLEPTSGSSSATKLIPYTPQLRRQFARAINPWIAALFLSRPSLLFTTQYWSISPSSPYATDRPSAVPIGFDSDASYLSPLQRILGAVLMAVPPDVRHIADQRQQLYCTAFLLLRDHALGLLSVWHPSLLTILTDIIAQHFERLVDSIAKGIPDVPFGPPPDLPPRLARMAPRPRRARELRRANESHTLDFNRIWPRLRVISCWADASASLEMERMRSLFPRCEIQPKGLIATEAAMTIPMGMRHTGVCALRSCYLELMDCREEEPVPLERLQRSTRYRVVVSTGSGFLRYDMGDVVEVCGWYRRTPRLTFVGRAHVVSDCVGEKLSHVHVESVRRRLSDETRNGFVFFMLSPVRANGVWRYGLFVEKSGEGMEHEIDLAGRCDAMLAENYHYAHARGLGQLDPVRLFAVEGNAGEVYISYHTAKGMKRGDIKFSALHTDTGWEQRFEGGFRDH